MMTTSATYHKLDKPGSITDVSLMRLLLRRENYSVSAILTAIVVTASTMASLVSVASAHSSSS
eukprot:1384880-Amorphochlora_amoeboformis.AAC.1